jgi:hypothetical protein
MEMSVFASKFKEYLRDTPKDVLAKQWAEARARAAGRGPTVEEFLCWGQEVKETLAYPTEYFQPFQPINSKNISEPHFGGVFFLILHHHVTTNRRKSCLFLRRV